MTATILQFRPLRHPISPAWQAMTEGVWDALLMAALEDGEDFRPTEQRDRARRETWPTSELEGLGYE